MTLSPPENAAELEARIHDVGEALGRGLGRVVDAVEGAPQGPQALARVLGLDKVLTSRLLRAVRQRDPIAVLHHVPGPEPLRRFLRAAARRGAGTDTVSAGEEAVRAFEGLLSRDVGDRSALDAILAAWLPEARSEFVTRRKQSAYKAMSQLRGCSVDLDLSAVFFHPARDGTRLDVVWVVGMFGLRRLRPGVGVKLSSRRITGAGGERAPTTLDGEPLEGADRGRLDQFCAAPPGEFHAQRAGELLHYTLGGGSFGPASAVDLCFAEVNEAEIARYVDPALRRRGYAYSDVAVPARRLVFDVFVDRDVYPGSEPELAVYDTAIHGVADVNDRARDIDRLDLGDRIVPLGTGTSGLRLPDAPRYVDLIRHVHERRGWDPELFRCYRVSVDYPIYGSQIAVSFDPPPPPDTAR